MINNIKKKRKRGFTLIELIIVIAIIAILAAIAIPKFATIRHNANVTTDISNAKNIHSVVAQKLADETAPTVIKDNSGDLNVGTTTEINSGLDAGGTKSKITNGNFIVNIATDGTIKVYADKTGGKVEVYPTASNDFKKE